MISSSSIPQNLHLDILTTPAIKKRNRNELQQTSHQKRSSMNSETKMYYLKTKAPEITDQKSVARHQHSKKIVLKSRLLSRRILKLNPISEKHYEGSKVDRRVAIKYLFISVLGLHLKKIGRIWSCFPWLHIYCGYQKLVHKCNEYTGKYLSTAFKLQ